MAWAETTTVVVVATITGAVTAMDTVVTIIIKVSSLAIMHPSATITRRLRNYWEGIGNLKAVTVGSSRVALGPQAYEGQTMVGHCQASEHKIIKK